MNLLHRLKRLDDAVLPGSGRHRIEQAPTDWERWTAAHTWQTALMAATVSGLLISAAWTLPDHQPELNNFVVRALIVGGIAFGLFAKGASALAASVRVRDRLRHLEDLHRDDHGFKTRP